LTTDRDLFPTEIHQRTTEELLEFLQDQPEIEAVLLIGSCARGRASKDSCVDIGILIPPKLSSREKTMLQDRVREFLDNSQTYEEFVKSGLFTDIDIEYLTGEFKPGTRGWTDWPDPFELEIGNYLKYSKLLTDKTSRLQQLKDRWLPYYPETLAQHRLTEAEKYLQNNLAHIPPYLKRALIFQSLDRLYHAFQEFLQALFIQKRTYPIAYNKWIQEQIEEILELPELYPRLKSILEIPHLTPQTLLKRARTLKIVAENYLTDR
jgi:predicted nucleotidyltransferase